MATPRYGRATRVALDADSTFDASSTQLVFISENVIMTPTYSDTEGMRNTTQRNVNESRVTRKDVAGSIVLQVDPVMLDVVLPYILGAAESSDTFALAETLPDFSVLVDRAETIFQYDGCKVGSAVFAGTSGGFVTLTLNLIGKTESDSATWPGTIPANVFNAPYQFDESTLTINSVVKDPEQWTLTINNNLDVKFRNSVTASHITKTDLEVTLTVTTPYDATNKALRTLSEGGVSGSLALAQTGLSTTFTFGAVQSNTPSPVIPGRSEIQQAVSLLCKESTSGTDAISVSNDSAA